MEGKRLIAITGVIATCVVAAVLLSQGTGVEGWRDAARATARTSLLLFLPVAAASSINALWGGRLGKWLLRNRRYLGLSFALNHLVHAVTVIGYVAASGASIRTLVSPSTLYGGGFGYVLLAAMAATSTNAATRALGRRGWNALHKTGMYVIGGIFLLTYLPRALAGRPLAIAFVAALGFVGAVRAAARVRARRRRR